MQQHVPDEQGSVAACGGYKCGLAFLGMEIMLSMMNGHEKLEESFWETCEKLLAILWHPALCRAEISQQLCLSTCRSRCEACHLEGRETGCRPEIACIRHLCEMTRFDVLRMPRLLS